MSTETLQALTKSKVLEYLREVYDPELGVNIVDLGLVYRVEITDRSIEVDFTLTEVGCPEWESIQMMIVDILQMKTGYEFVTACLVYEPRWNPQNMSDEARLALGLPLSTEGDNR